MANPSSNATGSTGFPLLERLKAASANADAPLEQFLDYAAGMGLELYPHQEEAVLELYSGKNLILNTPTGSGKSLVATALHFESLSKGRRSIYTAPIKALVNEKFLALCREFSPEKVGLVTGDASVNRDAPIICCTAEILANMALSEGANAKVDDIIMDEFHFYSDRERGVAWQIPLIELKNARFLLMSATLGDTSFFEKSLTDLTEKETVVLRSVTRPVPLNFTYRETSLDKTVSDLVAGGQAPVYIVSFTQAGCADIAQDLTSIDFCTKEDKKAIAEALIGKDFTSPYGRDVSRLLRHGIALHHAGLLPKYRILVESLAQRGLIKLICGTDTLGVGVNIPIRTVLFTQLCKFDGQKTTILSVRDFQQISGRAGRRGFDTQGYVVVQAPEHVIENIKMDQKASGDPKKAKKMVKKKPPEKGYIPWDKNTMQRLIDSQPEALTSRFQVNHAMVLQVLSRPDDGCRGLRNLIYGSHETPVSQKRLGKMAFSLFRSLVDRKIIEFNPLRVNVELQEDFSLHHALSLYLMDTLGRLDRDDPEFGLNALTLVESILENPELILRRQLDRVKTEKMAEMKAQGMEFDERIAELEKLEYPKPMRDFIYSTFNEFAAAHPWVGQENIRPKSVAREMVENFASFPEYIREYDLHRTEGLLLRYISSVYKVLAQTIPDLSKDDELRAIETYFGSIVRSTDSSLLEEWDRMQAQALGLDLPESPSKGDARIGSANQSAGPFDITRDPKAFTRLLRNEAHRVLRSLSRSDLDGLLFTIDNPQDWDIAKLRARIQEYRTEHTDVLLDANARNPVNTQIEGDRLTQILVDPDAHNDWALTFTIDRTASRERHRPVLILKAFGPIGDLATEA